MTARARERHEVAAVGHDDTTHRLERYGERRRPRHTQRRADWHGHRLAVNRHVEHPAIDRVAIVARRIEDPQLVLVPRRRLGSSPQASGSLPGVPHPRPLRRGHRQPGPIRASTPSAQRGRRRSAAGARVRSPRRTAVARCREPRRSQDAPAAATSLRAPARGRRPRHTSRDAAREHRRQPAHAWTGASADSACADLHQASALASRRRRRSARQSARRLLDVTRRRSRRRLLQGIACSSCTGISIFIHCRT